MKEIYVYRRLIGDWSAISKEEAEAKIAKGYVYGAELEVTRDDDEPIKITLMKDSFGFGVTEKMMQDLAEEYFTYVESITGMTTQPA